jgi:hypothetical protein
MKQHNSSLKYMKISADTQKHMRGKTGLIERQANGAGSWESRIISE